MASWLWKKALKPKDHHEAAASVRPCSKFGFQSTAEQVTDGVDGSNLTAIVTGIAA
jgi:hypothetical protein